MMATLPSLLTLLLLAPISAQSQPPSPVRVDAARIEKVQEKRSVTGQVRAARRALIASREPGLVAEMLVREGQEVERGQELARLDSTLLEAEREVQEAQRGVGEAMAVEREALVQQARRDLEVLEDLAGRDALNPKELADGRTSLEVAEARLLQARQDLAAIDARLALLERRLADMRPTAPFAGHVIMRQAEVGQWVAAGGGLVEILSSRDLEAWLDVPQAQYAAVRDAGAVPWIELDRGERLPVEGWRIVPSLTASGRTFPLIAELAGDVALAPGMSLTASLPTGRSREALTVARDGVMRGPVGAYVYVARPGAEGQPHQAAAVPLEVLFHVGPRAVVRAEGLQPGDLVVVEGNERLYPSAPVAPEQQEER